MAKMKITVFFLSKAGCTDAADDGVNGGSPVFSRNLLCFHGTVQEIVIKIIETQR